MQLSAIDQAFWFGSFAGEIALLSVLFLRRQYIAFPFFLSWIAVTVVSDSTLFWVAQHGSIGGYQKAFVISSFLDYALQLALLAEIAQRVLYPQREGMARPLRYSLLAILFVSFCATLLWTLSQKGESTTLALTSSRLLLVSFVFAFLRLMVFALIAGFSQMLGITWRNHVLRLASGLAFYSAVSLIVQLTISHLSTMNRTTYINQYHMLLHTQTVGYLMALAFWVWSFVQKDAPRREFTPQMERFLVTISETAKRSRVGFSRNLGHR